MRVITKQLIEEAGILINNLSEFHLEIINVYEKHGLFCDTELELANEFIGLSLIDLIGSASVYDFITSIVAASGKETQVSLCLTSEFFFRETNPAAALVNGFVLDQVRLTTLLDTVYHNLHAFSAYQCINEDFQNPGKNLFKLYFYNLNRFCGVSDIFIEDFFEADFQEFFHLILDAAEAQVTKQDNTFFALFVTRLMRDLPLASITTVEDFNEAARANQDQFLIFLDWILYRFAKIRTCTKATLDSLMHAIHLNKKVRLKGPGTLDLNQYEKLKAHLRCILEAERSFSTKQRKQVTHFLDNFKQDLKGGGFISLVSRQMIFNQLLIEGVEPFHYTIAKKDDADKAALHFQENTQDLQMLKRLNFVLEHRVLACDQEWELMTEKLVAILKSNGVNFFSDIFELYFFTICKNSGLQISLIPARRGGNNNDESTCDYKIGEVVCADAKCLTGSGKANFSSVSVWLNKVGKQVSNTTGYLNVKFGGGVIGIRDKAYGFLDALRKFKGIDVNNPERLLILQFIWELYSDFRKHTTIAADQVKFILFYYMPETELPDFSQQSSFEVKLDDQKEIMFILSTKYASDEEIKEITKTFKPISNYLFSFNNSEPKV